MISIIVPVYNVEAYLDRCVESLTCQTCQDLEILLIDDGSTDQSGTICDQWQKRDDRIRVLHQKNSGVSEARNAGLQMAKGEYLFFVDADDWLERDCLLEMLLHMEEETDFVSCDFRTVEEEGCMHPVYTYPDIYGKIDRSQGIRDYYESKLYTKTIWGKLYRRDLWKRVKFPKLAYSEDTYAMFEILEKTQNIYLMDQKYYDYLQRAGGASHREDQKYYEDTLVTLEWNYRKAVKQYKEYSQRAAQDYIKSAYALLKIYAGQGERKKALDLVRKMQTVKKESLKGAQIRSIRLLALPAGMVYRLICLKEK